MEKLESNDKLPIESINEEIVKKGFKEAVDQVAEYFGWDKEKSTGEFIRYPLVVIHGENLTPKEIAEKMAESLDEYDQKKLENQRVIVKKEKNEE